MRDAACWRGVCIVKITGIKISYCVDAGEGVFQLLQALDTNNIGIVKCDRCFSI